MEFSAFLIVVKVGLEDVLYVFCSCEVNPRAALVEHGYTPRLSAVPTRHLDDKIEPLGNRRKYLQCISNVE